VSATELSGVELKPLSADHLFNVSLDSVCGSPYVIAVVLASKENLISRKLCVTLRTV